MMIELWWIVFLFIANGHPVDDQSQRPIKTITEINREAGVLESYYDGDIILHENSTKKRRTAFYGHTRRWENNVVYYTFTHGYFDGRNEAKDRQVIERALESISSRTCVRFEENPNAYNRIEIHRNGGCGSALGMEGGVQWMSLGDNCLVNPGTVIHEFLHSLGFIHAHNRPDRDNYVTVDKTHVPEHMKHNFNVKDVLQITTPYDYGSIMHYAADGIFFGDKISIRPRDANYFYTIGSNILAFTDILAVNNAYQCLGRCGENFCAFGGYPNPNNCYECVCPWGFIGQFCRQQSQAYAVAETYWQDQELADSGEQIDYQYGVFHIFAPQGKRIVLKIVDIKDRCVYGCIYGGVELKIQEDWTLTGPRFCCASDIGKEFRTNTDFVPVVGYVFDGYFSVKIAYRFEDA